MGITLRQFCARDGKTETPKRIIIIVKPTKPVFTPVVTPVGDVTQGNVTWPGW